MREKRQVWASVVFIAVSVFYLACTVSIKVVNVFGVTVVSSATIPRILGVILLLLSCIQLYRSVKNLKAESFYSSLAQKSEAKSYIEENGQLDVQAALAEAEANEDNAEADVASIVQTISCLCLFALTIQRLGFMLSAFVYMVLQMTVLTKKAERKKKFAFIIILSAVLSAAIYYLFTKGLSLMLPAGILG